MIPFFKLSWRKWFWVWLGGSCLFGACLMTGPAQAAEPVSLTVQLRHSDGTAVIGEPVSLARLPDEEPVTLTCLTDISGRCTWQVGRGLYQLLFERPLDDISSLAVAEGGLRGFGVTVGDSNIAYHFTFHSDGRVYFDAAPEATLPQPVIPEGAPLQGGVRPTPPPSPEPIEGIATTATPAATRDGMPDAGDENPATESSWQLLLFISGGLIAGGGLHLWSRKRGQAGSQPTRPGNAEANDA